LVQIGCEGIGQGGSGSDLVVGAGPADEPSCSLMRAKNVVFIYVITNSTV